MLQVRLAVTCLVCAFSIFLSIEDSAAQLKVNSCSYDGNYAQSSNPQIGLPAPGLTDWEWGLVNSFYSFYRGGIPPLPILTLYNENNARAGGFGVAINRAWLNSQGKPMATAILAHELGHVCQAYGMLPIDDTLRQWGSEGQADYFGGRLLGATGFPQQLFEEGVVPQIAKFQPDQTHAPAEVRIWLTRSGYYNTR